MPASHCHAFKSAPLAYPDSSDASQADMEAMVFVTQPIAASILALTLLVLVIPPLLHARGIKLHEDD
ncbi:hypothetical protein KW837_06215 [Pseudomonas sp. PDM24]|uniref:hypothetical protein n=1 Tax=Pseudomonas sp. PDM24 TaxID=2854777 RepID=UPI001C479913|nr:hypothetical protein [Pseudomonas sp. PDM24]MBV7493861.1 hypothetical protein [Pseudomonas sp. PDM24]